MELFDDEDARLFSEALDAVVADAAVPAERRWRNDKSGHHGELRALSSFSGPDNVACKRVRIINHAGSRSGKTMQTLCNMPPEGWRPVPSDFAPLPKIKS